MFCWCPRKLPNLLLRHLDEQYDHVWLLWSHCVWGRIPIVLTPSSKLCPWKRSGKGEGVQNNPLRNGTPFDDRYVIKHCGPRVARYISRNNKPQTVNMPSSIAIVATVLVCSVPALHKAFRKCGTLQGICHGHGFYSALMHSIVMRNYFKIRLPNMGKYLHIFANDLICN